MVKENLIGIKFGRLVVIAPHENKGGRTMWLCRCDCGKELPIYSICLKKGHTQSCGCLQKERTSSAKRSHGMTETREYKAWCLMKARCYVINNNKYNEYGGRGIIVCERWLHSFENFYSDMGDKPTPKHTLDRINPDKNYEPSNCRWATQRIQQGNRRNNVWHEYGGRKMIQSDWGRFFGVSNEAINRHLKRGKSFKETYEYYLRKRNLLS